MASNGIEKLHRTKGWSSFAYINRNRAKKVAGNRIPAQRVSSVLGMFSSLEVKVLRPT
jgi:NADPH-dependent curcumin reductase CurA